MSERRGALIAVALAAASGAASAQISPNIPQVSAGGASVAVEPIVSLPSSEATSQLSDPRDSAAPEAQLTPVRSSHDQPAQLSKGPRSAQGPQALSQPAEGRTGVIDRVEGTDRCDAARSRKDHPAECSRVIETRADDYSRPAPTRLSPEQKLLLDQQLQAVDNDLADATRRLARSGEDDSSIESQAIASIVLGQGQPEPTPTKPVEDPAVDAATQAVLQILSITPPQN